MTEHISYIFGISEYNIYTNSTCKRCDDLYMTTKMIYEN